MGDSHKVRVGPERKFIAGKSCLSLNPHDSYFWMIERTNYLISVDLYYKDKLYWEKIEDPSLVSIGKA